MDFLTVAHALMDFQKALPSMSWHFEGDVLVVKVWCVDGIAKDFSQAQKMFEPAE